MFIIRNMKENDYTQKGYVYYKSWIETYTGLMDECLIKLSNYKEITVWVLNSNLDAISWYQAYGFRNNGYKKSVLVSENYQLDEVCL